MQDGEHNKKQKNIDNRTNGRVTSSIMQRKVMNYRKMFFFNFAMVLLLTGCSKDTTTVKYIFERNGALVVDRVSYIVEKYALTNSYIKEHNTSYEIGFPITLIETKVKGDGAYPKYIFMNVDLCKNKQVINKDIENILEEFPLNQADNYTFYFSFKKMINKNLININSSIQEDICMYTNSEIRTNVNEYVTIKSNTIKFTSDEINTIRTEYESLTQ